MRTTQKVKSSKNFILFGIITCAIIYFAGSIYLSVFNTAIAAEVKLAWDSSVGQEVIGYNIYYGTSSRNYDAVVDAGNNTSFTVFDLAEHQTYHFAVTAYDLQGNESSFSDELVWSPNSTTNDDILNFCPDISITRAQVAVFIERTVYGGDFIPSPATGIFSDVVPDYWAAEWIEQFYNDGLSKGCHTAPLMYCPENAVSRSEMAVFLLRTLHGQDYSPPPATGFFTDVPETYWAADWVEQLYAEGISTGCGDNPLRYCPEASITRSEMAVFLLRTLHGQDYSPPPAEGFFADVPKTHWAAAWIEKLYSDGITMGCSASP